MKKCLVICGGDFYAAPKELYEQADFVLACDRGYEYSKRLGFLPDLIVGDFDSCARPTEAEFMEGGKSPEVITLPSDKSDSDTLAGVKAAIGRGCDDFTLICAAGGRFDHFFCNLQVLSYLAERFGRASLLSQDEEIFLIKNTALEIGRKEGWSLSVFSFCDEARGVCESGTRWSLNGAVMRQDEPYGLSNEWSAGRARIEVGEGKLIIILSKMDGKDKLEKGQAGR